MIVIASSHDNSALLSSQKRYYNAFVTAPTASPTIISATSTSTTLTVQWDEVDCIDRNGDITGYSVRAVTSGENDRVETVDNREVTINGLTPSTVYIVSVAAVNSMGTGPYSGVIVQSTDSKLVSLRILPIYY